MQTLELDEAASFLKMNAQVLRRKAKAGDIPGKRAGKKWVFVQEHLADFISGRYIDTQQKPEVINLELKKCQSIKEVKRTGFSLPTSTVTEYSSLLKPKTKQKRNNSMTS